MRVIVHHFLTGSILKLLGATGWQGPAIILQIIHTLTYYHVATLRSIKNRPGDESGSNLGIGTSMWGGSLHLHSRCRQSRQQLRYSYPSILSVREKCRAGGPPLSRSFYPRRCPVQASLGRVFLLGS